MISGCAPGAGIEVSVDRVILGTAVADETGISSLNLSLPEMPVGRYDLVVGCGTSASTPLDVVVTSAVQTGSSTSGIFLFFLLLVIGLFRRRRVSPMSKTQSD